MRPSDYDSSVFVNCPYDKAYSRLFDAIVFAICHCGFIIRCAREELASDDIRLSKILNIISECKYSIHDISRTEIDANTGLPRFNMPLELGIVLGAKRFGGRNHQIKRCLILDTEPYRYRQSVSDIAGVDVDYHRNSTKLAITCVRNWLTSASGYRRLQSGSFIYKDYLDFRKDLPDLCELCELDRKELTFPDYNYIVTEWLWQKSLSSNSALLST